MPEWSVYILRCRDGSFYTGIATDVARRIGEHECGRRGAKYLRGRGPFEVVYQRLVGDRGAALRLEYRIKRLQPGEKRDLSGLPARVEALLVEDRQASEKSPAGAIGP